MFAILGAAGNVGYATSSALREAGVSVRAILRNEAKARPLRAIGCDIALADLQDSTALARAIAGADAVQIILPPPPQADDAVAEMRRSIDSLAEAIEQARPRRLLAISDYGAHVPQWIGMPSMFRLFEERLRQIDVSNVILRSAEHMQGWAAFFPVARAAGVLPSLHHPVDSPFPTISAPDLGVIAAGLLLEREPWNGERILHAEGPRRYNADDVAAAMRELLGRPVTAQALPREQWQETLERAVSPSAARLLIELYDAHNQGGLVDVEPGGRTLHGTTELIDALRPLVSAGAKAGPAAQGA